MPEHYLPAGDPVGQFLGRADGTAVAAEDPPEGGGEADEGQEARDGEQQGAGQIRQPEHQHLERDHGHGGEDQDPQQHRDEEQGDANSPVQPPPPEEPCHESDDDKGSEETGDPGDRDECHKGSLALPGIRSIGRLRHRPQGCVPRAGENSSFLRQYNGVAADRFGKPYAISPHRIR